MTMEYPLYQPVGPQLTDARAGIYRYHGLGGWHQTATLRQSDELQLLVAPQTPASHTPAPVSRRASPPMRAPSSLLGAQWCHSRSIGSSCCERVGVAIGCSDTPAEAAD